ncbi:MAG TPA: serine hydrolase domain-containing protein [Acidimicrobiales bacterium]|nr:serine hydrolase domain-containing protein [Acidimicrobiales bacterium]
MTSDGPLEPTVDPGEVGLDADRLARIGPYFAEHYVDAGLLAGVLTVVARGGEVAHVATSGHRDREAGAPMTTDTVFRIYSMTKPVTSVVLMSLYEEGRFQLDDPVSRFLPGFADLRVWDDGTPLAYTTRYPERPMTMRDLFTHTSGLTYGFMGRHPLDALYRRRGIGELERRGTLAAMVDQLAELPLLFSPGTRWSYSVATDVLGAVAEVITGTPFDELCRARVFEPLGLRHTGFHVAESDVERFAACYAKGPDGAAVLSDAPATSPYLEAPSLLSGGGGLVSTAADYLRFCQMLLGGGAVDGVRILGRKTVELMTSNHLPTGGDLASMGQRVFSETSYEGIGFGLGFSVMLDPARAQVVGSVGEYSWGGAASTMFWIDPAEDLVGILLTQLLPSSAWPLRRQMKVLTYAALVD